MATEKQARINTIKNVIESLNDNITLIQHLGIKDYAIDRAIANMIRVRGFLNEWIIMSEPQPSYIRSDYNS